MTRLRPVSSSDSLHTNRRHTSTSSREELPGPYNPAINRILRARPDELQGLLTDSSDNERGSPFLCIRTLLEEGEERDENRGSRRVRMESLGG